MSLTGMLGDWLKCNCEFKSRNSTQCLDFGRQMMTKEKMNRLEDQTRNDVNRFYIPLLVSQPRARYHCDSKTVLYCQLSEALVSYLQTTEHLHKHFEPLPEEASTQRNADNIYERGQATHESLYKTKHQLILNAQAALSRCRSRNRSQSQRWGRQRGWRRLSHQRGWRKPSRRWGWTRPSRQREWKWPCRQQEWRPRHRQGR